MAKKKEQTREGRLTELVRWLRQSDPDSDKDADAVEELMKDYANALISLTKCSEEIEELTHRVGKYDELKLAAKYGFTPIEDPTTKNGRAFEKGTVTVFRLGNRSEALWARAVVNDGKTGDYTYHDSLEEAFRYGEPKAQEEEKKSTPEPVMPDAGKIAEYVKAQPERVKAVQYTGENAAELAELTGWRCVPVPQGPGLRRVCLRTSQPSATAASGADTLQSHTPFEPLLRAAIAQSLRLEGEPSRHAAVAPAQHAEGAPSQHAEGAPLPFLAGTGRQAQCLGEQVIAEGQWLIRGPSGWSVCSRQSFLRDYMPACDPPVREVTLKLRCAAPGHLSAASIAELVLDAIDGYPAVTCLSADPA